MNVWARSLHFFTATCGIRGCGFTNCKRKGAVRRVWVEGYRRRHVEQSVVAALDALSYPR